MNDGRTEVGRQFEAALKTAFALECDVARDYSVGLTLQAISIGLDLGQLSGADLEAINAAIEDDFIARGEITEEQVNEVRTILGAAPRTFAPADTGSVQPQYDGREFIAA